MLKYCDTDKLGAIAVENFKNCLLSADIGLTYEDAQKINRNNPKDKKGKIDYMRFLKDVNASVNFKTSLDDVGKLARNIKVYMRSRNINSLKLIKQIKIMTHNVDNYENKVTPDDFHKFLM